MSAGAPGGHGASAVGVIGGGIMGSGIAEVAARSGCDVVVREVDDAACAAVRGRIEASLERAVAKGRASAAERDAVLERISYAVDLEALAERDLVIEAATENLAAKTEIFRALDRVTAGTDCVLASNTSSFPIMRLGAVTTRPERVVGLHFFNPVPVLPLVELIPSLATAPGILERARVFAAEKLGKQVVLGKDRAGFVVNALLVPYLLAAVGMVDSGVATAGDVDVAMVAGCAHPMGPLALADLIGLDTLLAIAESLHAEYRQPQFVPPPLLLRLVEAGRLGRKSGQGFHLYAS